MKEKMTPTRVAPTREYWTLVIFMPRYFYLLALSQPFSGFEPDQYHQGYKNH
jgi:hypothetical protein